MSVYVAHITRSGALYDVSFPDVPGCITYGETLSEAISAARDALGGCLCTWQDEGIELPDSYDEGDTIPQPDSPDTIVTLIDIDLVAYRRMTDYRAIRKNVSLPAWMAHEAERQGINCSQVLQNALKRIFDK